MVEAVAVVVVEEIPVDDLGMVILGLVLAQAIHWKISFLLDIKQTSHSQSLGLRENLAARFAVVTNC